MKYDRNMNLRYNTKLYFTQILVRYIIQNLTIGDMVKGEM